MLHSRDTAGIVPSACGKIVRLGSVLPLTHSSTWRGADPIQRARIRVLVEQVPSCKGFGVLRYDAESSAEEVECSGGVT